MGKAREMVVEVPAVGEVREAVGKVVVAQEVEGLAAAGPVAVLWVATLAAAGGVVVRPAVSLAAAEEMVAPAGVPPAEAEGVEVAKAVAGMGVVAWVGVAAGAPSAKGGGGDGASCTLIPQLRDVSWNGRPNISAICSTRPLMVLSRGARS